MTPLGSKETVIVIQPPDLGADVERAADGVELVVRARNLRPCAAARSTACSLPEGRETRTIWNDGALHDGTQKVCACGEPQRLEPAPDGVNQTESRSLEREGRVDLVVVYVVGDVLDDLVRVGADGRLGGGGHVANEGESGSAGDSRSAGNALEERTGRSTD